MCNFLHNYITNFMQPTAIFCIILLHSCTKAGCDNMQYNFKKHYYDPYVGK